MISSEARLSAVPPARRLSLQAALRSIGDELERLRVGRAVIRIVPEGIELHTATEPPLRHYAWDDLRMHAAAQRGRRAGVPARGAEPAARPGLSWPDLLRVVGTVLDSQGVRTGVIHGTLAHTDDYSLLEVHVRGRRILDLPAIQEYERWAQSRRGRLQQP